MILFCDLHSFTHFFPSIQECYLYYFFNRSFAQSSTQTKVTTCLMRILHVTSPILDKIVKLKCRPDIRHRSYLKSESVRKVALVSSPTIHLCLQAVHSLSFQPVDEVMFPIIGTAIVVHFRAPVSIFTPLRQQRGGERRLSVIKLGCTPGKLLCSLLRTPWLDLVDGMVSSFL